MVALRNLDEEREYEKTARYAFERLADTLRQLGRAILDALRR